MKSPTAPRIAMTRRPLLLLLMFFAVQWPTVALAQSQAQAQHGLYWAATLHGWVAAMLALMATVVGLVSGLHQRERSANFLVGMMLSWVVLRASATPGAAGLRPLLMTLLVLCGVQYLLRQMNWKRDWIDHALLIQCLIVPASLLLTGSEMGSLSAVWHAVLSLELLAAMGWALWLRRQRCLAAPEDAEVRGDFRLMATLLVPTI